jgi:hypothetical protein
MTRIYLYLYLSARKTKAVPVTQGRMEDGDRTTITHHKLQKIISYAVNTLQYLVKDKCSSSSVEGYVGNLRLLGAPGKIIILLLTVMHFVRSGDTIVSRRRDSVVRLAAE